jgi:hypothetical protein
MSLTKNRFVSQIISSMRGISNHLSLITLWLLFSIVLVFHVQNNDWNKENRIIRDDVLHYYYYSVSWIVYHDIDSDRVYDKIPSGIRRILSLPRNETTGKTFPKMAMGLSIIYSPFVLLAHYVLTPLMGSVPDGYSAPYKIALVASSILFFLWGIWQLRKLLRENFNERITALTLIVIALGTNLSWYISSEATMSHVYSFALIIYLYRLLNQWFRNPKIGLTILTGLIFGLIVLIRPTNILYIVLFFASDSIRKRMGFLMTNIPKIVLMIIAFIVIWIPQLLFWKYVSGSYFNYTYGDENFFWNNPQILGSLFSFRKGWLIYTPLMLLTFIGLPVLWNNFRKEFWQVLLVLISLIYINSSWWCWWYGGSYGLRTYIDSYGVLAFSVAAFFQFISGIRNKLINTFGTILIFALIGLNLFQTWQYQLGLIHYDSQTNIAYRLNFLKSKPDGKYYESLIKPDYQAALKGIYYTKNEISNRDKSVYLIKLQTNKKYLIRYYENLISGYSNYPADIRAKWRIQKTPDSINNIQAGEMYEDLLRKYY